jgi:hypothetical protein
MRAAHDSAKGLHVKKLLRCKDAPEFISYSEWEASPDPIQERRWASTCRHSSSPAPTR